jgi:hypothetical protein
MHKWSRYICHKLLIVLKISFILVIYWDKKPLSYYKTSSFISIRPTNMATVFGNNSKTVNNIRNLTGVKMISTARSNYPEILKKIWLPILEFLPSLVSLVQLFQRSRLKYEKLTDGRRTPSDGNTSHDPLGQVS